MKTKASLVLFSLLLIVSCAAGRVPLTQNELNTAYFGDYPYNYQQMVIDQFSTRLYDPYSAQYYFVDPVKAKDGKRYGYLIQMAVNAKNRMGGYSGRQLHHFMIQDNNIWETNIFHTSIMNEYK